MSDGTDVRDRHGNQLRSMGPLGDEKDDIMSTKVEGAAKLPRIPLAGGLPRTPWRIEDRRPADFRDEPRLLVKVVKKGLRDGINSYVRVANSKGPGILTSSYIPATISLPATGVRSTRIEDQ